MAYIVNLWGAGSWVRTQQVDVLKNLCSHSTRGHSLSTSCGLTGRKGLFVLLRRRAERLWDLPPINSPPELHIVFKKNWFPRSPRKKKGKRSGRVSNNRRRLQLVCVLWLGTARQDGEGEFSSQTPLTVYFALDSNNSINKRHSGNPKPLVHSSLHRCC